MRLSGALQSISTILTKSTSTLPDGYQEQTLRFSSSQMWGTPSRSHARKGAIKHQDQGGQTGWQSYSIFLDPNNTLHCNSHQTNEDVLSSLHDDLHPKKSIKALTAFSNDQTELLQQYYVILIQHMLKRPSYEFATGCRFRISF
jgi:hypothetical protein